MTVRLTVQKRLDQVMIRVVDNGAGMDKERLAQVREQIKTGTKSEPEENRRSTGIGMYNVVSRIRLYCGVEDPVRIFSKKGRGTLTVICLPYLTKEDVETKKDKNDKKDKNRPISIQNEPRYNGIIKRKGGCYIMKMKECMKRGIAAAMVCTMAAQETMAWQKRRERKHRGRPVTSRLTESP